MMEQDPRRAIHIRERVLRLAVLLQHLRRDLARLVHELEQGVSGDGGPRKGVVYEGCEARVWAAEDGVPIAGDDAPGAEGAPEVGGDGVGGEGGADGGLHGEHPAEDFLGGEAGWRGLVSLLEMGKRRWER